MDEQAVFGFKAEDVVQHSRRMMRDICRVMRHTARDMFSLSQALS